MELTELFKMQRALDAYIQQNREEQTDVFRERGLALLVELAELANETRCFKFWSKKGPSARDVILEEYVDSIHFLLSLGLEKGFETLTHWPTTDEDRPLTEQFIMTNGAVHTFLNEPTMTHYQKVWEAYDVLARALQFTNEEIIEAYIAKNKENYERQNTGY